MTKISLPFFFSRVWLIVIYTSPLIPPLWPFLFVYWCWRILRAVVTFLRSVFGASKTQYLSASKKTSISTKRAPAPFIILAVLILKVSSTPHCRQMPV